MFALYPRRKSLRSLLILGVTLLLTSNTARAEFFGFANGRMADVKPASAISVELGFVSGEFAGSDYQNTGFRANYLLRDGLSVYLDLTDATVGRTEDTAYGVGVFYALGKVFDFAESVAIKGSLHNFKMGDYRAGNFTGGCTGPVTTIDTYTLDLVLDPGTCGTSGSIGSFSKKTVQAMNLELLFSGKPLKTISTKSGPANWYANVGMHTFNGSNIDNEISFGAGLVVPFSSGEFYGGIDVIDEMTLNMGYRLFVK